MGVHKKGSVLLAEDDPMLARQIERRLRAGGWDVDAVSDGEAAVDSALQGVHDVMLLDMRLPRLDGLGVLESIRDAPVRPPVVLMSGYLDEESTVAARDSGAAEIIEKPVPPQRLVDLVGEIADRHRGLHNVHANGELLARELLGVSRAARTLRAQVASIARFRDLPVMIVGDTGTGKELVARALHRLSHPDEPFVSINCAAMPESLFESELFGHEAGSFTGARTPRPGLLQVAGRGTVFLDEVGEMPPAQQAKLLRALETRSFRRVGSNTELPLHARIVSATNRRLRGRSDEIMRSDLYFRLAVLAIRTPALAERMDDLELLARHFLADFSSSYPAAPTDLSPRAIEALRRHDWPGNIRELKAVLQSAAVRCTTGVIGVADVVETLRDRCCLDDGDAHDLTPPIPIHAHGLPQLERDVVTRVWAQCEGNLSRAARRLQIPRSTLRDRLRRYGLR